ncbi:MAG TPA: TIM barrel protein [Friedmanniella sp.]
MSTTVGLVAWRLPGRPQDSPRVAARVGAHRLQVDYGGHDRQYELEPVTLRRLKKAADDVGVAITAVAVNALNDVGVVAAGSAARQTRESLVHRAVDAARALNASVLLVPAFRRSAVHTPSDLTATASFLVQTAEVAGEAQLPVVHENVLTPSALAVMRAATDDSGVRFLFDIGNLHEHGVDWRAYLAGAGPALHSEAHIKDYRDRPAGGVALGEGHVPLARVLEALHRTGAVECLIVETDHRGHDDRQIRADLQTLAHLMHDDDRSHG